MRDDIEELLDRCRIEREREEIGREMLEEAGVDPDETNAKYEV